MRERVCKNCGGKSYKVVGQNMVKCRFCGTLYVDEHASKEEEVLVIGANEIARALRFEDAVDEFNKILNLFPMSFEGYFGRALARNKIVLTANKRSSSRNPVFFDKIINLFDDADFKKAVELAPEDTIKTYNDIAKKIERYKKQYDEIKDEFDVIVAPVECNKNKESIFVNEIVGQLRQSKRVYFVPENGDKEPNLFHALETSNVLLLINEENADFSDVKNVFDRYFYFTTQKRKSKSGLIVAVNEKKIEKKDLPKEFLNFKNIVSINQPAEEVVNKVLQELEKTSKEVAKIDTVTLSNEAPQKKENVEIQSINPVDLGHYEVENMALSDENKIEWIFLLLKNGDFETANKLIARELEKDPNNARLMFAELLCSRKIRTQEDFFASVSNFKDMDKIQKILSFSQKDFAENFVDNLEGQIIKLGEVEYYQKYLLFLAGFNTPNRENFIGQAENLAVETMDENLIEDVQKCFNPKDVDRFVNFYYALAQKSGEQKYYDKILSLDQGHEQSNMTKFLEHFKTPEQILSYKNKTEIEEIFKFLSESSRTNFVMQVADMILPIAYKDLEAAESQLDFYLSYISDSAQLCLCLNKIATSFQEMRFFKQAEKYISIALSKDNQNADFYWTLIKVKAHCNSDGEVITSPVKFSDFEEWESLISVSSESQREKYAEIVSKNNLFKGERSKFLPDMLDEKNLKAKLSDFLNRNHKILLEINAEQGIDAKAKADYFQSQLKPLEQCLANLENCQNYDEFAKITSKIETRLDLLDLTFETSINVLNVTERDAGLKQIYSEKELQEKKHQKQLKKIREDKFIKGYLCGFLEFFPLCFLTFLLAFTIFYPKQVYAFFNQTFLIVSLLCTMVIALANIIFYYIKRKKLNTKWKIINIVLFAIGIVNLILFVICFYLFPSVIQVSNANELKTYLENVRYGKIELSQDIDMKDYSWQATSFSGVLDGKNHTIKNLNVSGGGLLSTNSGTIKNLQIELSQTFKNGTLFGGIAQRNNGTLQNCTVSGTLSVETNINSVIGGLVGEDMGGKILNCKTNLVVTIKVTNCEIGYGGYVGRVSAGTQIFQSSSEGRVTVTSENAKLNLGGLIGTLNKVSGHSISQNVANLNISLSGTAQEAQIGGLVGLGYSNSDNNYTKGSIDVLELTSPVLNVGGLYGKFESINNPSGVSYSYSSMTISAKSDIKVGGVFGYFSGSVKNCFSVINPIGDENPNYTMGAGSCKQLSKYDPSMNFSSQIWVIPQEPSILPRLIWENN